ncbi:MAG: NADPH-dependent 7-cyano-7-deazaguanine reductase QueF [Candidatus Magasanikbacteria bacterium CG10_big_fil_rev_8_21_14_0_10_43_6]|uniref:NADPH-dependent 7-cyano-7-deazaguanine reductase n=1 Tax=Candidatus Magasanikbacteria bacterium CG10_big_fil_rev_8_21_14_0_10_43_6 TaxID=1974650 RepID=A0A2M6W207_9BACT|nr:MAG: NADPH-dependent 7-cyano-7-deazaguanine reductase QueF [Candidatus Magasanikbacteria bacterium CG10_big_fil_rev_8_21_14_0_10_43_6]
MPTQKKDLAQLDALGKKTEPRRTLEVFPNHGGEKVRVTMACAEFSCFCPMTHQPDYATLDISYTPDEYVLESKSVKLYLESFRNVGIFHEHLVVDIAKDIINRANPHALCVTAHFNRRGGIAISASYEWSK